jgi:hypothetical protein
MIFLSAVLAPLVRSHHAAPEFMALFRSAARRFRIVAWLAMGMLLITGPMLLLQRGMAVTNPSSWSPMVSMKLWLAGLLFVLTLVHDLVLGPRVSHASAKPTSSRTAWEHTIVGTARWLPRLALFVALGVLFAAVVLARS